MAMDFVIERIPPLAAEYAKYGDSPTSAATDDMLMIEPPPDFVISGMAARHPKKVPSRCTRKILRQSSVDVDSMSAI